MPLTPVRQLAVALLSHRNGDDARAMELVEPLDAVRGSVGSVGLELKAALHANASGLAAPLQPRQPPRMHVSRFCRSWADQRGEPLVEKPGAQTRRTGAKFLQPWALRVSNAKKIGELAESRQGRPFERVADQRSSFHGGNPLPPRHQAGSPRRGEG